MFMFKETIRPPMEFSCKFSQIAETTLFFKVDENHTF